MVYGDEERQGYASLIPPLPQRIAMVNSVRPMQLLTGWGERTSGFLANSLSLASSGAVIERSYII